MGPRFPKSERIIRKRDFEIMKRSAVRVGARCFSCAHRQADVKRIGIIVSRRIGTAVERNRIKRVVREYFRLNKELFPNGDTIVIAKQLAADLDNKALRTDIEKMLENLKAVIERNR